MMLRKSDRDGSIGTENRNRDETFGKSSGIPLLSIADASMYELSVQVLLYVGFWGKTGQTGLISAP
jgi:hypothetical protein